MQRKQLLRILLGRFDLCSNLVRHLHRLLRAGRALLKQLITLFQRLPDVTNLLSNLCLHAAELIAPLPRLFRCPTLARLLRQRLQLHRELLHRSSPLAATSSGMTHVRTGVGCARAWKVDAGGE